MHSYSPNSDVFANKARQMVELTRKETIKRNSFPGPDQNRFIEAFMKQQRESAKN